MFLDRFKLYDNNVFEFVSKNKNETYSFGYNLSKIVHYNFVIFLFGNLGIGKTLLTEGMINGLLRLKFNVISPTYNIIKIYKFLEYKIYHCDFYRLLENNDVYNVGIHDCFNKNYIFICEWPNFFTKILPVFDLRLYIVGYFDSKIILFNSNYIKLYNYMF